MKLHNETGEIFIPDGVSEHEALARTTHLCIAAHQDDIEIMAYHSIAECFGQADRWFTGAVVTDGAGSPRDGIYADYTDEQMKQIRKDEQKKAAVIGEYGAQFLLDYPSSTVKDPGTGDVVLEIKNIIAQTRPTVIYTHNLADKHDTHVAVVLRTIQAIRLIEKDNRPQKLLGCEVWRDLDWLVDSDKVALDVSAHENLAAALLGVFDSQICGGKRYDLATLGRRKAHASYYASHGVDNAASLSYAMDMTPLMLDDEIDPLEYITERINAFAQDVRTRVVRIKKWAAH